jgi:malate dehydrogenase (oxaloacetate-decarboxylating)
MLTAAAGAIASMVGEKVLREDYIIPSVFNRKVPEMVAREVIHMAVEGGLTKLEHNLMPFTGI